MKTVLKVPTVVALYLLSFFLLGCSGDNPSCPGDSSVSIVTGIVVAIENLVPVNGGVTIDLSCLGGRSERLLLPSFFRNPPPSEDQLELYQVILLLEIGDLVQAGGTRAENGIELDRLKILLRL
ncbi:MAG: hypothetical protein JSV33_05945 [bacterium]|nr:MAG: hypothetical protein JSV33_05945 [bacterium]